MEGGRLQMNGRQTESDNPMAPQTKQARRVPDKYVDLVRAFPLRPIRTEEENTEAIELLASLGRREPLEASGRDYLDVLVALVERFEEEHGPMPQVSGPAMVRCLMDGRGLTQAETAKAAGIAESAFSEMLAGKRKMTAKHIRALARFFGMSADVIIGDCE
ncbi:MAG: helix-turn-helix domain-containing protein [Isosphaeraceae bacterium]|nr:helix-turn-helix domain-containing protein [Isosphaeraceae bacterium]